MSVAFASREPTKQEVERLRLVLSTYRDGSGMVAAGNQTYPGWRDFERAVASVLGGTAPETKGVFDVIVPSTKGAKTDYGLSIKSKALKAGGGLSNLAGDGRVYMELSNSPAKFLAALALINFVGADFSERRRAAEVGEVVLKTVSGWHDESVALHAAAYERKLDLGQSKYLVLSYSLPTKRNQQHAYQWHSFGLKFPKGIKWEYSSPRCLRGFDPAFPNESLFDFYLLSGGQLKYYPRASSAIYSSSVFQLEDSLKTSALLRAARMFPREWLAAKGSSELTTILVTTELENMSHLIADNTVKIILDDALRKIRALAP